MERTPPKSSLTVRGSEKGSDSSLIRLNKFIAESGVASRRKADRLISQGQVLVNGKKVYELGIKVDPKTDRVTVEGQPITRELTKYYILFHKPKNIVTTMVDPEGRPCVADYFDNFPARLFPVGRLDWDTEGLLILTNDGDFANRIMHPAHEITKTYLAKVDGHPTEEELNRLTQGVTIPGGKVRAKSIFKLRRGADNYDWYRITITEGKNRQIHHMFNKLGYDVMKLQRVAIGHLELGNLDRGQHIILSPKMIERIFETEEKTTFRNVQVSSKKIGGDKEARHEKVRRAKSQAQNSNSRPDRSGADRTGPNRKAKPHAEKNHFEKTRPGQDRFENSRPGSARPSRDFRKDRGSEKRPEAPRRSHRRAPQG